MQELQRMKDLIALMNLKNSYWGYLFSLILRVEDDTLPAPMGVRPEKNGTVSLVYNPTMISKMSDEHIKKVLEHEGMHLINKHIPRFLKVITDEVYPIKRMIKQRVFNIASDMCVNSQIADMPKALTIDGKEYTLCFPEAYKMERGQTTEVYYEKLLKDSEDSKCWKCLQKQIEKYEKIKSEQTGDGSGDKEESDSGKTKNNPGKDSKDQDQSQDKSDSGSGDTSDCDCNENGKDQCNDGSRENECGDPNDAKCRACAGSGNVDSHESWAEALDGQPDPSSYARVIDEYLRDIIHTTAKDFKKRKGNLPAGLEELINEALKPPTVPYYQIIRKLVIASRYSKFKRHFSKINRKRTYVFQDNVPQISPFPGRARDFSFDICICVDTSGSMGIEELMESLSGIKNMIDNDRHCIVHVIEIDTVIQKEYEVKKLSDIDPVFKGRGGTDLFLALERAKEINPDVTLFFTDGYCEDINAIPRNLMPKKLIWIITKGGQENMVNKCGYVVKLGDE